jgi:hypothetical protein
MAELTNQPLATIVNWFMILIIFVFDPLAIAMVVAANMAFANIKGVAKDPKDYEVYKKEERTQKQIKEDYLKAEGDMRGERLLSKEPEVIEKIIEVPVEKIVTKDVIKKIPKHLKATIYDALKHARRKGEDISEVDDMFFED